MKRNLVSFLILMLLVMQQSFSQQKITVKEDFDRSPIKFTVDKGSWVFNIDYYLPSLSGATTSRSYLGHVPTQVGDSTILRLTTPCNFLGYDNIQLRFSHICKVSPSDITMIQYREGGTSTWKTIEYEDYLGKGSYSQIRGFNASSYTEWNANDSTVIPTQSWWKEEFFDLSPILQHQNGVEFRFVIIHGNNLYSHASFGWLLENIQITWAKHKLSPPTVEFIGSYPNNTVYVTGPHEINARVETTTNAPIKHPWLKYTVTEPGKQTKTDSILMTHVSGNGLWKAIIPQYIAGTKVEYYIIGVDTTGNEAVAWSEYVITRPSGGGQTGYVIIGTGTTSSYRIPIENFYYKGWTRQIYLASELSASLLGGMITELAWDCANTVAYMRSNQQCYFKAVDVDAVVTGYVDPIQDGATLVWSGNYSIPGGRAWANILLDQPFVLPQGKNLMVYWISDETSWNSNAFYNHSTSPTYRAIHAGSDASLPTTATGSILNNRPNVRFYMVGTPALDYSAAISSIDMADTIIVSPGLSVPIVATIKNKGEFDMDSVTVSYSVNNAAPLSKKLYFNSGLPWDYTYRDTLGYYIPGAATNNTITVWVSSPNGVYDSITWDDTLTKIVYGSSDILAAFVEPPANIVNATGPYGIKVSLRSISGSTLPLNVSLNVACTYQGTTTHDTLEMLLDAVENLWKATIPKKRFDNIVVYSIDLTDRLGNNIVLSNNYTIKRSCEGTTNGCDTNSVALVSIDSPEKIGVLAGYNKPIRITLRNKGVADLDSCYLNWSLNGVQQPNTTVYKGTLPDDFTDTITVGTYIPVADKRDTIKVWVSMPNGKVDPVTADDALTVSPLGCGTILSGNYLIGKGGTYAKLDEVLNAIRNCGVNGNLVLQLKGEHVGNVNLSNISDYLTGYTLTITSYDNNADSAIIKVTSGAGITLNNTNNIILKAITVDATTATTTSYAIQFTGACTNVIIRDCKLLTNTTTTSTTVSTIYKAQSNTGIVNKIFIINNLLDGGYNGFYFYGAPSNTEYGTNVRFDSNTVSNQSNYACAPQYVDFLSYSHNIILSRTVNISTSWHGLRAVYCNGPIIGNRIHQRSAGILSPDGMLIQYYNQYPANKVHNRTLVANNEVITSPTGGISAVHFTQSKADFINNSIHVSGSGNAFGVYILNNSLNNDFVIKNNNIIMTSATGRPINFDGMGYLHLFDIDYNNLVAPAYIGYYGSTPITTMAAWRQLITTDHNSVSIQPTFVDLSTSLEIINDLSLLCNVVYPVTTDIRGNQRTVTTTMGCYDAGSFERNATLWAITGLTDGSASGQTENVKVIVFNTGKEDITSINLGWSVDGIIRGSAEYPVFLQRGDSTTITVGTITYPSTNVTVTIWINSLNTGSMTDEYAKDDTISRFVNVCSGGGYGGVIRVGNTMGSFPTFKEAYDALILCGVTNDITIEFEPGEYSGNIDISNNTTIFGAYKLTVTSSTSHANDVRVYSTVNFSNVNNVIFKNITIDVASIANAKGIVFTGICSNIEINGCTVLVNTTATTTITGISYLNTGYSGNQISNISILNNRIDGGYRNIDLSYLGGVAGQGLNNRIDSNILTNASHAGIYVSYYGHVKSVSNNIITTRDTTNTIQYGIHFRDYSCVDTIANNRILLQGTGGSEKYGLDLYNNINNATYGGTQSVFIANNEVRHLTAVGSAQVYGILIYLVRADILHNSVYIKGTTAATGMYINTTNSAYPLNIKNNLFSVETSATGYPLNTLTAASVTQAYGTFLDYNDYYSTGANIANIGGAIATLTALRTATGQDTNSVSVKPLYINADVSLECSSYDDMMECPLYNGVTTDIQGNTRLSITIMGAYTDQLVGLDLRAQTITPWDTEVVKDQIVQINVNIACGGTTNISSATFGWSLNGQVQQTNIPWSTTQALGLAQQDNVHIGSFTVTNVVNAYNVVAWIESVNGQQDMKKKNDTARVSATLVSLAEFTKPFNGDTLSVLSFDVPAVIRTGTGAPQTPPELTIVTTIGTSVFHKTVPMTLSGGLWVANVPQQYYGSKVVYLLNVSDTKGNSISLKDSVFIIQGTGTEFYTGHNLAVFSLASPIVDPNDLCVPDYLPVQVSITNWGMEDYDFTQDSIKVCAEIIDPKGIVHLIEHTVNTGGLESGQADIIEIMQTLPIYAGLYKIKAWVSSPIDHIIYDDTLFTTYASPKIGLPIQTDFSAGIPIEFISSARNDNSVWKFFNDPSSPVQPDSGMAMICFDGPQSSVACLSTGQLDLFQAYNPFVEFWYYHDTAASNSDYTNTEIKVRVDNAPRPFDLGTVFLKDPSGRHGWTHYIYYLNQFTTGNACVLIEFVSMNKYPGSVQYIDYIRISSEPDAAVSEIIITPEPTLCNRQVQDISIVISATRSQSITFDNTASIILDINGTTYPVSLQGRTLIGNSSDTILVPGVANITIPKGITPMRAYFGSKVDNIPANDTARKVIDINPGFDIRIHTISQFGKPALAEFTNNQKITITNTGNMEISGIGLVLTIDTVEGKPPYFTTTMTFNQNLLPGDSNDNVTFTDAFDVPWRSDYIVKVHGYLLCDPTMVETTVSAQEYVNMDDLYMVSIEKPLDNGAIDITNSMMEVSIKIKNRNPGKTYNPGEAKVGILLTDTNGNPIDAPIIEELPTIGSEAEISFTFEEKYRVPQRSKYHLNVFIVKIDQYTKNDTLKMIRKTDYDVSISNLKGGVLFTMEQNIPNPAKDNTIINYNIPRDGEILFHVYSVSGQLLYTKQENLPLGEHQVELNLSDYASGIYFYTMEYNGQRITKRMSIKR